nr:RecName: Full=Bradykinin-potentiating peptide 12b; Short=BPP-12b [Bothrops jararaca]
QLGPPPRPQIPP